MLTRVNRYRQVSDPAKFTSCYLLRKLHLNICDLNYLPLMEVQLVDVWSISVQFDLLWLMKLATCKAP